MTHYILVIALAGISAAFPLIYINVLAAVMKRFGRTDQIKEAGAKMKTFAGYCNMTCGRLSLICIAGGLFIMAADYIHNWNKDDNDPAVNVTNCMHTGECEAS